MYRWITIMAGGPQDGLRTEREYQEPRPVAPAIRAFDGAICCPIATHTGVRESICVVVHPAATKDQIERAVDAMLADDNDVVVGDPAIPRPDRV